MKQLAKILCLFGRHDLYVKKAFSHEVRCVGCRRCHRFWGMHDGVRAFVPWDGTLGEHHNYSPYAMLLFAILALAQVSMAQDFSFRTMAAFDGHQTPKWGGTVEFVKRQSLIDVVGTFTTRKLPDGIFFQTVELGGQKTIYKTSIANVFACGNIGYEGIEDNAGYLAGGCFGFESKAFLRNFQVVGKWKGTQESLRDTTWQGALGLQYNFKGE